MNNKRLMLPNSATEFWVEVLRERLDQGLTVRIAFGGASMRPLIDGDSDIVILEPLRDEPRRGDVCFFVDDGRCKVHRLLRRDGDRLLFRGDNCVACESVPRDAVLARLAAVEHADGTVVSCRSARWRLRSAAVVSRRAAAIGLRRLFSRRNRQWMRWLYFAALLVLMWAPVGVLGVPLNNFVLGIRMDHLLHASVYIPCVLFFMDFFAAGVHSLRRAWLAALLLGLLTESVQYLLPYRGFDINDLVANAIGVTVGWLIVWQIKKIKH